MAEQGVPASIAKRTPRAAVVTACLVALASLLVYLPALRGAFVDWDDNLYVRQNPFIRALDATLLDRAFSGSYAANWHPLTWLSHALDYALWGLNPLGHHLTSIVLHAANAFLVVLLVTRLGRFAGAEAGGGSDAAAGGSPLAAAAATGLLFGLHPLHVESVAWVSQRKDLLCALFYLLSLHAYAAYAGAAGGSIASGARALRDGRFLGALAFCALALLSKPMALSLPAVLLLLDWHPLGRVSSRRSLAAAAVEKLPFVLLGLPVVVLTFLAQGAGGALVPLEEIPLTGRSVVAVRSLGLYLVKMLFPAGLSPYYPYPQGAALYSATTLLLVALAAGATAAAVTAARRGRRLWLAAWGWYALTLAPVLGIVQVGRKAMADRYTYLPSLGPFLAAGAALAWAWGRAGRLPRGTGATRRATVAGLAVALLALSALTARQTAVWKDSVSLWNTVIERSPVPVSFFFFNRAIGHAEGGRPAEAIADYGRAIALEPGNARAWTNRGLLHVSSGRPGPAAADFTVACRLGNDFACRAAQFYAPGGRPP